MTENNIINSINPRKAASSVLTRDDFDGGPISLDQIEDGLWLGK